MTWTDAVDIVVARTKHEKYRELCEESRPGHDQWRAVVIAMAVEAPEYPPVTTQIVRGESQALIPLQESLAILNQIKACPYRSRDSGCGCAGMRCALGKGKSGIVSFNDCLTCVKGGS